MKENRTQKNPRKDVVCPKSDNVQATAVGIVRRLNYIVILSEVEGSR
jgi:hypothetical protein